MLNCQKHFFCLMSPQSFQSFPSRRRTYDRVPKNRLWSLDLRVCCVMIHGAVRVRERGACQTIWKAPSAGDLGHVASLRNLIPYAAFGSCVRRKINSSYARENSGNSVIFNRTALGRLEFYKNPNWKIRLEQKMV